MAAKFYRKWLGTALGERIQELLRGKRSIAYYDSAHTDRLALYALFLARHRSDHRALAAMYLLTATETLRRCAIPRIFDLWGIDIRSWSAVRTLSEQEYVLFQAAKGIWQSQRTITIPELCDRKLVEDKTLELILNAALIAHYGRAMLALTDWRAEHDADGAEQCRTPGIWRGDYLVPHPGGGIRPLFGSCWRHWRSEMPSTVTARCRRSRMARPS